VEPARPARDESLTRSQDESIEGTKEFVAPPGSDLLGQEVAGYSIEGVLGRGGMGIVYRARQKALKRTVALKMILASRAGGEITGSASAPRARPWRGCAIPNNRPIYEIGDYQGQPFFSLEFVEGGSLARQLNHKPLPPREAAALLETLARAIHAATRRQSSHRDLKPGNVLLTAGGAPKVTDFGLAKQVYSKTQPARHPRPGRAAAPSSGLRPTWRPNRPREMSRRSGLSPTSTRWAPFS